MDLQVGARVRLVCVLAFVCTEASGTGFVCVVVFLFFAVLLLPELKRGQQVEAALFFWIGSVVQ